MHNGCVCVVRRRWRFCRVCFVFAWACVRGCNAMHELRVCVQHLHDIPDIICIYNISNIVHSHYAIFARAAQTSRMASATAIGSYILYIIYYILYIIYYIYKRVERRQRLPWGHTGPCKASLRVWRTWAQCPSGVPAFIGIDKSIELMSIEPKFRVQ